MRIVEMKFYLFFVLALICFSSANGQEILQKKKTEIRGKGMPIHSSNLFQLFGKTYYSIGWGGNDQVYYEGKLFAGSVSDTIINHSRRDQFIFELDSNLELNSTYVIDNCEEYSDHTNTDAFGVMLINFENEEDSDSMALMTLPEGIQLKRKDYLDQSVLIVTDSSFNYIEHLTPTTGKILLIEGGSENLYMTIRIPFGSPYILVGQDTFYNKPESLFDLPSSLILASYNLTSKSYNWSKWIGGTYLDYIYDFKIDSEENLVLLVNPLGAIKLESEDTLGIGSGPDYNIVLKFDKDGKYKWGENFENSSSEYFVNLELDEEGGVYLTGYMHSDIELLDTFLSVGNVSGPLANAILLKLKSTGEFDWAYRVNGEYSTNTFHKLVINNASQELFLSGYVEVGNFVLNDINYTTSSAYSSPFILNINLIDGTLKGHISSQEGRPVSFLRMAMDETDNLIAFVHLNDIIHLLGVELTPFGNRSAGYLLRISSEWDSIVNTHELLPDLFKVYPNPILVDQSIQLELNQSSLTSDMHALIFDMQGFVVKSLLVRDQKALISTAGLMPGAYTLCVYSDGFYKSEIIVIQ